MSQSLDQLRRKVVIKSKEAELFKNKWVNLTLELEEKDEKIWELTEKLNAVYLSQAVDAMDGLTKCSTAPGKSSDIHSKMLKASTQCGKSLTIAEWASKDVARVYKKQAKKSDPLLNTKIMKSSASRKTSAEEIENFAEMINASEATHKKEIVEAPTNFSENTSCLRCDKAHDCTLSDHTKNLHGLKLKEMSFYCFKPKKDVVEPSTTFSSRFMPNVKFIDVSGLGYINSFCGEILNIKPGGVKAFATGSQGDIHHINSIKIFESLKMEEVDFHEAMPELVPDGMVYDKDSDSLVEKEKQLPRGNNPVFVCLDEFAFYKREIARDPEAYEAFLSKALSRTKKA